MTVVDSTISIGWEWDKRKIVKELRARGFNVKEPKNSPNMLSRIGTRKGKPPTAEQRAYATTSAKSIVPTARAAWQKDRGWVFHSNHGVVASVTRKKSRQLVPTKRNSAPFKGLFAVVDEDGEVCGGGPFEDEISAYECIADGTNFRVVELTRKLERRYRELILMGVQS